MRLPKPEVRYCVSCTVPSSSAVPVAFNSAGVCSACDTVSEASGVDWLRREKIFRSLCEDYINPEAPYDCIIPVSGGKDSYWQVHLAKKYGLRPLLVTYNGNNYSETGLKNVQNMREAFEVDHIFFTPSIGTVKKLNRICQIAMGDMNWHAHAGIFTYPIRVAVEQNIPLMIWGEHGFMDLGGMHSYKDMVEFTYRYRHEHCLRGYEWSDMLVLADEQGETLTESDLTIWKYPSDEEINRVDVRGIFISNFFKWDANKHGPEMVDKYGFLESEHPFERTYRTMSNLDDIHENGIHDYMKWVKFGYGRATDHTAKDVRSGRMTRDQGISEVLGRDHVKSEDLHRWLHYVGWTQEQFDRVADTFRDPRVWWIRGGEWCKRDIDGVERSYGVVHLDMEAQPSFFIES